MSDTEWELMYQEYVKRVPKPVAKADPPVQTRMEEQFKQEDEEESDERE
jgi:hypothetical protein